MNLNSLWRSLARGPVVITVHGVLSTLVLAIALNRSDAWCGSVMLAVAGFVAWTAFEYGAHRWLLHNTGRLRVLWMNYHLPHHSTREMADPGHNAIHLWMSFPILLPIYFSSWALGVAGLAPLAAGFGVGYCAYELLHWVHHATNWTERFPRFRYLGGRAELHVSHHFQGASKNFGFVTSFWDQLLGTYQAPRTARPHREVLSTVRA